MNIIDHRILIPASQDKVWLHISDLTRNPKWQVDCKAVSILTTMKSGQGTRWRYTAKNGRDYVVEATAWYDRLGYEYRFIDGTSYQSNKGIIRLQEVPEGTIVQWTFSYELSGLLSGLQNTLTTRRRVENEIIDSLRALYRYVSKSPDGDMQLQAKSLMRDAPDVEARAHYRPRHTPNVEERAVPPVPTPEPAVEPDDTRPNPVVTTTSEVAEPDFLARVPPTETVPVVADTDAPFRPPETIATPPTVETPVTEARVEPAPAVTEVKTPTVEPPPAVTEVKAPVEPPVTEARVEPPPAVTEVKTPTVKPPPTVETPPSPVEAPPPAVEPPPPAPTDKVRATSTIPTITDTADTAKVSVFELFGLPKPSETQEIQAVKIPSELPDVPTALIETPEALKTQATKVVGIIDTPSRIGLRLRLRRKLINLRRPG